MIDIKKKENPIEPTEVLIEKIIQQANLNDLPEGDKKYLRENLTLQLNRRLGLIIIENLNDEGRENYVKLLEGGTVPDAQEMQGLLVKYLPDYQTKIRVGLDEFIEKIIVSLTKEAK